MTVYEQFFGFSQTPFTKNINPGQLYPSKAQQELLASDADPDGPAGTFENLKPFCLQGHQPAHRDSLPLDGPCRRGDQGVYPAPFKDRRLP